MCAFTLYDNSSLWLNVKQKRNVNWDDFFSNYDWFIFVFKVSINGFVVILFCIMSIVILQKAAFCVSVDALYGEL